jgi:anti-sigma factor RsiW
MSDIAPVRQDFAPRIMVIATAVAIAGAFLAYPIEPWGPRLAAGLMFGWAALALFLAFRQRARDAAGKPAPPAKAPPHLVVRVFGAMMLVAAMASYLYAQVLTRQGASDDVVQTWRDGAMAFVLLSLLGTAVIDWVVSRLKRRREA